MGVPTSEVGYTSVMPRREDHEVRKVHVGHWIKKMYTLKMEAIFSSETLPYILPHYTDCILHSYLRENFQPSKYIDYLFTLRLFRACSVVNIAKTQINF